ncbi:MAG: protein kinase [Gemmatimonadota bacterium]|nr:MAG: protein kinase [Gemmatimonadota bacterium]
MREIISQLTTALTDRYAIERELGAGGMATVYLAHDVKHERKVALKVLRPELAAVIGAERFLAEIKVTANLQHPHILPLHDSGEAESFLYYVMPFVEGQTLRDKLDQEKQLSIELAIEIAKGVAHALDFAHRQGVIHRDIKPENVLIHDGQPLIADFGIALAVSQAGDNRLTETGLSVGTPHYMSPEQAMGDRELDARSDVYSLGAMLYEMLAGDPPYQGNTAQAIVAKVITEKAPPVTATRDTVPPHVAAAIAKSLNKLPADRFATAAQFADALSDKSFTAPATTAAVEAAVATTARWDRTKLALTATTIVLGLLALGGWLRPRAQEPRPVIRYSMSMPDGEGLIPRFGSRLALSPDGSRLVYVGPGEGGGQLWVRQRDQLNGRPLPGTNGAQSPFFSPDGASVGFSTPGPRSIKVASLGGGPPVTVADSGLGSGGASWGTDGFIYADAGGGLEGLVRIPATGGVPEFVSAADSAQEESSHHWPHALPGGKGVLFTVSHGSLTDLTRLDIAVLDLATGSHEILVRGVAARYTATGHLVYVTADGSLMAAPFDEDALELTGPAVALTEGIALRLAGSLDVALSETGTLAYVTGGVAEDPAEMVWVDREGRQQPVDPNWFGEFYTPAISPDGTRLAVAVVGDAGRDLWIKQLDTGPLSRITFPMGQDHRPWWTADGRSVLFISDRGETRDLYRRRADGVGQPELQLDLPEAVNQASISPDGEWLVYRTGRNNALDIYARRLQGDTTPIPLINDPNINEHSPTLSRDGKWLAYVSDESGRWELYVRPFPNINDGRWQVSTSGGSEPVWSHSGRELFYKNTTDELMVSEVQTDPTFMTGQQHALLSVTGYYNYAFHPQYDVTPDDQRFIMIRFRGVGESGELIVVENWFDELMERVGK